MAILIMISIQWTKQIACNQYDGKYHIKIGCLCEKCSNLNSLINTIASFIDFFLFALKFTEVCFHSMLS